MHSQQMVRLIRVVGDIECFYGGYFPRILVLPGVFGLLFDSSYILIMCLLHLML